MPTIYWYSSGYVIDMNGYWNVGMTADDDTYYGDSSTSYYDNVFIGGGFDTLYLNGGNDQVTGHSTGALIYGGNGEDRIRISGGNATLYGEQGNDGFAFLIYNPNITYSDSYAYGGIGNDGFSIGLDGNPGFADYTGELHHNIYTYGESGIDSFLSYNKSLTYVSEMHGGHGNDKFRVEGDGLHKVFGDEGDDYIQIGGAYFRHAINAQVNGGEGNDVIWSHQTLDSTIHNTNFTIDNLLGGTGNDFLMSATTFVPSLNPNAFLPDTLFEGGTDSDMYVITIIQGQSVNYTISDESGGDDRLYVRQYNSTLDSVTRSGADLVLTYLDNSSATTTITIKNHYAVDCGDLYAGGIEFIYSGTDPLLQVPSLIDNNSYYYEDIYQTYLDLNLTDNVLSSAPTFNTITGTANSDTLHGTVQQDIIYACAGNDKVYGNDEKDVVYGGAGIDRIYGHGGDDELYGEGDKDYIYGNDGDDQIWGGDGQDWLYGDEPNAAYAGGNDIIYGGQGADNIYGYGGNDELYGDHGADKIFGHEGDDYIDGGVSSDTLYGGDGLDTIIGDSGYDKLYGDNGNDTLDGGKHDDKLYGGAGDDTLIGGSGDDSLYGDSDASGVVGSGNDTFNSGAGADTLFGHGGSDTFIFEGETAYGSFDTIGDFTKGVGGDVLDISDVLNDLGYDALNDALADWVTISSNSNHSFVQVSQSGDGGNLQYIAQLSGDTTITLTDLVSDGNLITV